MLDLIKVIVVVKVPGREGDCTGGVCSACDRHSRRAPLNHICLRRKPTSDTPTTTEPFALTAMYLQVPDATRAPSIKSFCGCSYFRFCTIRYILFEELVDLCGHLR
jgi:hypothetical protein